MAKKRKKGGGGFGRPRVSRQWLSPERLNIQREAEYIVARAQAGEGRIVTVGSLVLFSTDTGDAWALDPEDRLALPLCRGGEVQSYNITDTPTQFLVEWKGHFDLGGAEFVYLDNEGRATTIVGYPVAAIAAAIERQGKG